MRGLVLLLALISSLYLYFVAASVLNIIAKKEAASNSASLQSAIGQLEGEYFSLSQSVTPEAALSLGLTPLSQTSYVFEAGNTAAANVSGGSVSI